MVPPLSAQPALRRRELHVQQAAQHELCLAGTCGPATSVTPTQQRNEAGAWAARLSRVVVSIS